MGTENLHPFHANPKKDTPQGLGSDHTSRENQPIAENSPEPAPDSNFMEQPENELPDEEHDDWLEEHDGWLNKEARRELELSTLTWELNRLQNFVVEGNLISDAIRYIKITNQEELLFPNYERVPSLSVYLRYELGKNLAWLLGGIQHQANHFATKYKYDVATLPEDYLMRVVHIPNRKIQILQDILPSSRPSDEEIQTALTEVSQCITETFTEQEGMITDRERTLQNLQEKANRIAAVVAADSVALERITEQFRLAEDALAEVKQRIQQDYLKITREERNFKKRKTKDIHALPYLKRARLNNRSYMFNRVLNQLDTAIKTIQHSLDSLQVIHSPETKE